MKNVLGGNLPIGFGMALAQNLDAMNHFASLPHDRQMAVIDGARHIRSKQEMQAYVNRLTE